MPDFDCYGTACGAGYCPTCNVDADAGVRAAERGRIEAVLTEAVRNKSEITRDWVLALIETVCRRTT